MSGDVILITSFSAKGTVTAVRVVSGPPLLRAAAMEYVKSWQANAITGERNCPVVIEFRMTGQERECTGKEKLPEPAEEPVTRRDPQHVRVTFNRGQTCFTTCY